MIDLHLHTNYSDGTDTVKELLIHAEEKGLDVISITDHDSVGAYKELENKEIRNIFSGKIIVGTELKAYFNGIPVEVLGYGIDYNKIQIKKIDMFDIQMDALKELKRRAKKLGLVFDENISVSKDDPKKQFAANVLAQELLRYPENKEILLAIGPEFDVFAFYRVHASNKKSVFYYDESQFGMVLEDVIKAIHDAGGMAFLAHPLLYPYDDENKFNEIEKILCEYDLDGLECIYPLFSEEERENLKAIALRHNKYVSGGTDYHANSKPNIKLGTGIDNNISITKEFIEAWINKVDMI